MFRKCAALISIAILALTGAACTQSTSSTTDPPPAPAGPTQVKLGQTFDIPNEAGQTVVRASFDKIEVDPACTSDYGTVEPSAKGHYIAIQMTAETTSAYNPANPTALGYPTAYDFQLTGPDGMTESDVYPSTSELCIADRENFDGPFRPSAKYQRWLLIESKNTSGELFFKPHFATFLPGWTVDIPKAAAPANENKPAQAPGPKPAPKDNCGLNPADMDHKTKVQCGLVEQAPEPQTPAESGYDPEGGYKFDERGCPIGDPNPTPYCAGDTEPVPQEQAYSGYTCEPNANAEFNNPANPNEITNKACGYTAPDGSQHNSDPWIEDQLRYGCEQGYIPEEQC